MLFVVAHLEYTEWMNDVVNGDEGVHVHCGACTKFTSCTC